MPGLVRNGFAVRCLGWEGSRLWYFAALLRSLRAFPSAGPLPNPNRPVLFDAGVFCGELTQTWVGNHREGEHVYIPVHALRLVHWESLRAAAQRAMAGSPGPESGLKPIADFVRLFCCLHPFAIGNFGLVMTLANGLLAQQGLAEVPHCILDVCAHRLNGEEFAELFGRVQSRYGVAKGDGAREGMVRSGLADLQRLLQMSESDGQNWLERSPEHRSRALLEA
jgi:hypothetical protein